MSTYGYAVEQATGAVHVLATTDGPLRQRFLDASVHILAIPTHDLPQHLKEQAEQLKADLTNAEPTSGDDRVTPTIQRLSVTELSRLADRLVALSESLLREWPELWRVGLLTSA